MRGDDQIALARMDDEVIDADRLRQAGLVEMLPDLAGVERDIQAQFRAREEQILELRRLPHHAHHRPAGRLPASGFQVSPKSVVRKMYGLTSSLRWRSMATKAVPASKCEHSIRGIARSVGTPGIFSRQVGPLPPSSFETHSLPSSVPTQSTPCCTGDSAMARIVCPLFAMRSSLADGGEVGADLRPRVAAVGGLEEELAAVVERLGVVRREQDGRVPVVAVPTDSPSPPPSARAE